MAYALSPFAAGQQWQLQAGGAARGEWNDNYFFTADNAESAFVLSLAPFLTATQKTDTSELAALFAVGANKVWGPSGAKDYVSGRLGVSGMQSDAVSSANGSLSISRAPALQNEVTPAGIVQTLAFTDNAMANAVYSRALSERWSAGATVSAYANHYDKAADAPTTFQNNWSWSAGANAGYAVSSQAQLTFTTLFSHYSSDVERDDSVTATAALAYDVSPRLAVSGSVGYFWTSSDTDAASFACSAGVGQCGEGRVRSHDDGVLFGGSVRYSALEQTILLATAAENLAPSGTGALSKNSNAALTAVHRFTDRLTGRVGASYTRTKFPTVLGTEIDRTYAAEIGASYALGERWTLDAGYRYLRTDYSQNDQQPRSNIVFLSIAYNWPGANIGGWSAIRPDTAGLPGAGPSSIRQYPSGPPDLAGGAVQPSPGEAKPTPFDQLLVP